MAGNFKAEEIFGFSGKFAEFRYYKDDMVGPELHTFGDASNVACEANVCSHTVGNSGLIKVNLIYSKSGVASQKMISIPCLGLSGNFSVNH